MKKILLIMLLGIICASGEAKSLVIKTTVKFILDVNTGKISDKKELYVFFEFDPIDKKTIELTENGKTYSINILKYEIENNKNMNRVDFTCDNENEISLYQYKDSENIEVTFLIGRNPVVTVYANH